MRINFSTSNRLNLRQTFNEPSLEYQKSQSGKGTAILFVKRLAFLFPL